jgi:RNA polymerase sigma factor (sigma-70 family)
MSATLLPCSATWHDERGRWWRKTCSQRFDARKRVVVHRSGSALPWLYGIAMNVLRRYFRHRQPSGAVDPDLVMDWDAVDARLDAEAQRRRLRNALCTLSDSDRDLLLLVAWEGLTSAEAAAVLGISKVAARSRLHRARHRALQAMQGNADLSVLTTQATRGETS